MAKFADYRIETAYNCPSEKTKEHVQMMHARLLHSASVMNIGSTNIINARIIKSQTILDYNEERLPSDSPDQLSWPITCVLGDQYNGSERWHLDDFSERH